MRPIEAAGPRLRDISGSLLGGRQISSGIGVATDLRERVRLSLLRKERRPQEAVQRIDRCHIIVEKMSRFSGHRFAGE
jgi:hypothetical protein